MLLPISPNQTNHRDPDPHTISIHWSDTCANTWNLAKILHYSRFLIIEQLHMVERTWVDDDTQCSEQWQYQLSTWTYNMNQVQENVYIWLSCCQFRRKAQHVKRSLHLKYFAMIAVYLSKTKTPIHLDNYNGNNSFGEQRKIQQCINIDIFMYLFRYLSREDRHNHTSHLNN